ncbi:FAD-dependent oxidoreductase [Mycolicibacterium moriokaense]|uniref:NADH dehydrogenase n=1 Tax=Mycolicibacterium moriokaense TaxID=39691 RepID=A0AAD1H8I5_9MYCO|nr:FAD-dependent oxidoreductase [Mycolicibacterium moriokaense]MCV7041182.1 FAD-dependent oxidoreductase [Mycolicibacterium moriokaense]ORB27211.1 FAD-dependent oxidoreductase [Mycolicibacterium moriokaense]BBX00745.1 NADH dehydrogenase [Mycolicibacterium moriokaense]
MTAQKTRVIVIGGGYAGVLAANHLRLNENVDITLVNPRAQFVERIRLHQLVTGSDDAVVDYSEILGDGIHLTVGSVTRIDAPGRHIELARGGELTYDYLIYAIGSHGAAPVVPGADEFAYPISELEQAQQLKKAFRDAGPDAPITVIGAGPTGLEVAAEFAEEGRRVTLVCGGVLGPYLHARGRRAVAKRLNRLGVTIIDGPGSTATEVRPDVVILADGRTIASTLTVWTAGFGVPDLAASSGLSTDAAGRLLTDETLTSIDDPRIVAAGDAAAPSNLPLRMSCQAAIPLGAQAANTVLSRIAGTEPKRLNQAFTGQCISLGRTGGLIQLARFDDAVIPLHIGGRTAAKIKEAVCKGTVTFLQKEARKPGSYFWIKGGKREQQLAAAARPVRP